MFVCNFFKVKLYMVSASMKLIYIYYNYNFDKSVFAILNSSIYIDKVVFAILNSSFYIDKVVFAVFNSSFNSFLYSNLFKFKGV